MSARIEIKWYENDDTTMNKKNAEVLGENR